MATFVPPLEIPASLFAHNPYTGYMIIGPGQEH
jgi:hypothetical protein